MRRNLHQLKYITKRLRTHVGQIRPAADALYASPFEPWSEVLMGTQGVAPDPLYDPLEFVVEEAHSRGIEVHAWLNPYRGSMSNDYAELADNHICNTLREFCYVYDKSVVLLLYLFLIR